MTFPATAIVTLKGIAGGDACGACALDGKRMIILQFENAISGELLPPIGIPLDHVPKFGRWLCQAIDAELERLGRTKLEPL